LSKEQAALNVQKADQALKKFRKDAGLAGEEFDVMFKTFKDVSFDPSRINAALAQVGGDGIGGGGALDAEKKLELKQLILDAKQARLDEKDAIDGVSDSERDHKRAVEDAIPFQQKGIDGSKSYAAALDGIADAQRNLNRLEADRRFDLEQQKIKEAADAAGGLNAEQKKLLGQVKKLIVAFKYAFGPAGQALLDGFMSGLSTLGGSLGKLRNPLTNLGKAMGNTFRDFFKVLSGKDAQNSRGVQGMGLVR
jgi:hypothetical protein